MHVQGVAGDAIEPRSTVGPVAAVALAGREGPEPHLGEEIVRLEPADPPFEVGAHGVGVAVEQLEKRGLVPDLDRATAGPSDPGIGSPAGTLLLTPNALERSLGRTGPGRCGVSLEVGS